MKKSLTCPKCEGRKLLHIERMKLPVYQTGAVRGLTPIPYAFTPATFLRYPRPVGSFETFICRACGYTEWYADGAGEVEPDDKNGIHVLDNEPKATLR